MKYEQWSWVDYWCMVGCAVVFAGIGVMLAWRG